MRDSQRNFVAGLCSGTGAAVVGQPLDTIRTRLQAPLGYAGAWDCARGTVRQLGVGGLWAGLGTQLVSLPLMQSLGFAVFGLSLRQVERVWPSFVVVPGERGDTQSMWRQASSVNLMVAGSMTALPITLAQCPMERIKCLLQTAARPSSCASGGQPPHPQPPTAYAYDLLGGAEALKETVHTGQDLWGPW